MRAASSDPAEVALSGAPSQAGGPPSTTSSLARSTVVMTVGTALSRLTGFARLIITAAALGVTRLSDSYNVANTTPNILYDLVLGGILSAVFVPVFVERFEARGGRQAWHSARAVMTFTFLLLLAIMILGIVLGGAIIHLYTIRDDQGDVERFRQLATVFLILFMPQVVFYGIGAVATGLLNAHRRFAAPMFAPILNNLTVIAVFAAFIAIAHHQGRVPSVQNLTSLETYLLAGGTTLGVAVMTAALWPSLRRTGFRWHFVLDLADPALRRIGRLAGWIFVYVLTNQLGYLVVIILSAQDGGDYTAYSYAYIFFQLPFSIFAVSVFTALLPSMSSRWTDGDLPGIRQLLAEGTRATAFVIVPAAIGLIVLATPIVRLVAQHGLVDAADTRLMAAILVMFAVGLPSFSLFQMFMRGFYGMQDTRTPAVINLAATALNVVANVVLYTSMGVVGLALGQSIAYTFALGVSAIVLRRRLSGLDGRSTLIPILKIIVAGAASGAAAYAASHLVAESLGVAAIDAQLAQVIAGIAAGVAVFLAVAAALRVRELGRLAAAILPRRG